MKGIIPLLILVTFAVTATAVPGQKKSQKPRRPGSRAVVAREMAEPRVVREIKDFGFVATLDNTGNATVAVQMNEASNTISPKDMSVIYSLVSGHEISKGKRLTIPLQPVLIIKAPETIAIGKILDFVRPLRKTGENRIKVLTGDVDFMIVPAKVDPTRPLMPDPLTLVVEVDDSGNIALNNEQYGSMRDLSSLSAKLTDIFRARSENGVFRAGTNQIIETSVMIKPSPGHLFADVVTLEKAIRRAGSDRIFLLVDEDDLPSLRIDIIKL